MVELTASVPPNSNIRWLTGDRACFAALAVLTWLLAWPTIFSTLALYDDEGYVMMTLQSFMQGHRLYGETHTQYGPAFYLLTAPLHEILHWPLSQAGVRVKTILVWMIAVWLCFIIVRRMSQSTAAAMATAIVAALHLDKLALEPGHPQEWTLLGTLAIMALFSRSMYTVSKTSPNVRVLSTWFAVGWIAAIVGLVKLNCGVVLAIPLLVTAMLQIPAAHRWRWIAIALVFFPAMAAAYLGRSSPTTILWALWIGLCAATLVHRSMPQREIESPSSYGFLGAVIGSASLASILILGLSLAQSVSIGELWVGIVSQHSRFADYFFVPLGFSESALSCLSIAIIVLLTRRFDAWKSFAKPAIWIWVALSIASTAMLPLEHGLNPRGAGLLLAWAVPGWIVWIWREDFAHSPKKQLLGLVAILSPLIAFPVSGTQVQLGTLPALLMVGIMLGEFCVAQSKLQATLGLQAASLGYDLPQIVPRLALGVLIVASSAHWWRYRQGESLGLPGSTWMRLPKGIASEQRKIAEAIVQSDARYLLFEGNNHNRFYFWTGLKPLTNANPTFWPLMLFPEEEKRLARAIDDQSRLCVVRVPEYEKLYFEHASEIRKRLDQRWQPSQTIGDWQIGIVQ